LDVWQKDGRFKELVSLKWSSYEVQGGGIYIFKEKLKKLKADLKVWNKDVFGDVNHISENLQKKIIELDDRDDERGLADSEREEKRSMLADFNKFCLNKRRLCIRKQGKSG